MAKCPNCGIKLHIWNVKAECPKCGVNIANYDWENRLEQDAVEAEIAFAKLRESLRRFKYSFVGTKLRIARIPISVLPLFSFLLPLGFATLNIPFYSETITLNAINIVMKIIENTALINAMIKLPGSEIVGDAALMLLLSFGLVVLSILSLLVSLVFLLTNFKKFQSKGLGITNLVACLMMIGSSICFGRLSDMLAASTLSNAFACGPQWGVYVSAGLFLLSSIVNFMVSFKKVELPPLEEKNEAKEEKAETEEETVNA